MTTTPLIDFVALKARELQDTTADLLDLVEEGETDGLEAAATKARAAAESLATRLVAEGVTLPILDEVVSRPDEMSLGALASLASPNAAELLTRLEELLPLADSVDSERGRSVGHEHELLPGESRGTDIAETLSTLILRLRREVGGARGKGLE